MSGKICFTALARRFVVAGWPEGCVGVAMGSRCALLKEHGVTQRQRAIFFRGQATRSAAVCNIIPRALFYACPGAVTKASQL